MGTSSSTVVYDDFNRPLVHLYGQYDGYEEGHGAELVGFLQDKILVDGIGEGMTLDNHFNGIECAAAAIVAHFKKEIGGYYIEHPNQFDGDYLYEVYEENGKIVIDLTYKYKTTRILG